MDVRRHHNGEGCSLGRVSEQLTNVKRIRSCGAQAFQKLHQAILLKGGAPIVKVYYFQSATWKILNLVQIRAKNSDVMTSF